jgi:hypothetical protein
VPQVAPRINYIIAGYIGRRRSGGPAGELLIKRHLDYLQKNNVRVDRISVVISADNEVNARLGLKVINSYTNYYTEIKTFVRHNVGFSYAAWNDAINQSLERGDDFDYYFLIEDDYIPARSDFIDVFVSKLNGQTAFACQKVFDAMPGGFQRHAAVSNGVLDARAARIIHNQFGVVFDIEPAVNYPQAERNQVQFLNNVIKSGYKFSDTSDVASIHYLDNPGGNGQFIKIMNEDSGPPLLLPIVS